MLMSWISRHYNIRNYNKPLQSSCRKCFTVYGSESWTVTDILSTRIDGTYTRLFRAALNVSWKQQYLTNRQLYGVIQVRRLQFAGHCYRSKNEVVNRVILWEPRHGRRSQGRPAKSYINILAADTGAERSDVKEVHFWKRSDGAHGKPRAAEDNSWQCPSTLDTVE